jgi:hypothetical protein
MESLVFSVSFGGDTGPGWGIRPASFPNFTDTEDWWQEIEKEAAEKEDYFLMEAERNPDRKDTLSAFRC